MVEWELNKMINVLEVNTEKKRINYLEDIKKSEKEKEQSTVNNKTYITIFFFFFFYMLKLQNSTFLEYSEVRMETYLLTWSWR